MLSESPKDQKERIVSRFYGQLAAIEQSPNGFFELRQALVESVAHYARYQVLALNEVEKARAFYRNNAYISGGLHHHIRDLAAKDDYLANLLFNDPKMTDLDLVAYSNRECAIALYAANGFNKVRLINEGRQERDWYKPFVEALLVYEEDNARASIGLPSLLPANQDGVFYSFFFNYVLQGEENPLFSWMRANPDYSLTSAQAIEDK